MCSGLPGVADIPAVVAQVDATSNVIVVAIPAIPTIPGIQVTVIPARCSSRVLVASILWNYYNGIGCISTANNMHFGNTLRSFYTEWVVIVTPSKQDLPKFPTLTKTKPPLR